MPVPKSVMKINKKGIQYTSNVDQAKYTINELSRAALRDVAKFIRKEMIKEMKELPGMRRSKRPYKAVGYWVRKREADLQIGFGNTKDNVSGDTWYGIQQELGSVGKGGAKTKGGKVNFTRTVPKKGIMRNTVYKNIPKIIEIQSQYLSALNDMAKALLMAQESENANEFNEENE